MARFAPANAKARTKAGRRVEIRVMMTSKMAPEFRWVMSPCQKKWRAFSRPQGDWALPVLLFMASAYRAGWVHPNADAVNRRTLYLGRSIENRLDWDPLD